jgi:hypothetical protein
MIERIFDPSEVVLGEQGVRLEGVRGSAWVLDDRTLVTIEHVARGARLNDTWKDVTIFWSNAKNEEPGNKLHTRMRFKEMIPGVHQLEYAALLEVEYYVPGGMAAQIRATPLRRNEPVVGMGYAGGKLRFAEGRLAFPEPSGDPESGQKVEIPLPYLPFEMYDPEGNDGRGDRYALDYGASGGPIFDCNGNVAAIVQGFHSRQLHMLGQMQRVTTAWGTANVSGISASSLFARPSIQKGRK